MKNFFLRAMLGVCMLDVLLGAVLASFAFFGDGTPRIWRGVLILLVAGGSGFFWFGSALRRQSLEART